jgi:hypothetical protein
MLQQKIQRSTVRFYNIGKKQKSKRKKPKKEKKPKEEKLIDKDQQSSDDEPLVLKHGNSSSRSLQNVVGIHMNTPTTDSQSNVYLPPSSTTFIQQSIAQQQAQTIAISAPSMKRIDSKASQSSSKSKKSKKSKRERAHSESGSSNSTKLSPSTSKGSLKSTDSPSRKSRQSFRKSMDLSANISSRPPSRIAPGRPDDDDKPLAVVKDQYQPKASGEVSSAGSRKSVSFSAEPVSETKIFETEPSASEASQNMVASVVSSAPVKEPVPIKKKKRGFLQKLFCCITGADEALSPVEQNNSGLKRTESVASYRSLDPKSFSGEYSAERPQISSGVNGKFMANRASMLNIDLPIVHSSPLRVGSTELNKLDRNSVDSFDLGKGLDDIIAKYKSGVESANPAHVPASTTRALPKRPIAARKSMDMDSVVDEELLQYKSMF